MVQIAKLQISITRTSVLMVIINIICYDIYMLERKNLDDILVNQILSFQVNLHMIFFVLKTNLIIKDHNFIIPYLCTIYNMFDVIINIICCDIDMLEL